MRYFSAMRVYTQILSNAWSHMKDFLVFFGAVVLFVSIFLYCLFETSGGNFAFTSLLTSFREMLRMSVGFYDFESLTNNYVGVWICGPLLDLSFFVLVFMLILLGQNVILAIVVNAYDEAKQRNNLKQGSENAFLYVLIERAVFLFSSGIFSVWRPSEMNHPMRERERKARMLSSTFMKEMIDILLVPSLGDISFYNIEDLWREDDGGETMSKDIVDEDKRILDMFAEDADPQLGKEQQGQGFFYPFAGQGFMLSKGFFFFSRGLFSLWIFFFGGKLFSFLFGI